MKNILTISMVTLFAASTVSWIPTTQNLVSENSFVKQNEQEENLKLNNGKRWKANAETTTGVNNMIKKMEGFSSSKNVKTLENYNDLAKELRLEMNGIFDKCTMKGESHNNLHAFLVPIFGYLKELESEELKSCKNGYASLDLQLEKYSKYFE